MSHEKIVKAWKNAEQKPNVFYLICLDKIFAVAEDHTSIIICVSETKHIYSITKNKVSLAEYEGNPVYVAESPEFMRVISCGESTIRQKEQVFVIKNILPLLKQ